MISHTMACILRWRRQQLSELYRRKVCNLIAWEEFGREASAFRGLGALYQAFSLENVIRH